MKSANRRAQRPAPLRENLDGGDWVFGESCCHVAFLRARAGVLRFIQRLGGAIGMRRAPTNLTNFHELDAGYLFLWIALRGVVVVGVGCFSDRLN